MRRSLVALVGASLVVAACGDDSKSSEQTTAVTKVAQEVTTLASTTTVAGSTAAPSTTAAAKPIDTNATLRFSYQVGPTSWDPARMSSSFDTPTAFFAYDRLVHLNTGADPIPGIAEKWEFSADGKALTFTLRKGVKFHDGTPLDAEAVKANLLRNAAGASKGELAPIDTIDTPDPLTVKLNLKSPGGSLPGVLTDRPGVLASPKSFADEAATKALDLMPVGAGMYKVTEFVKDQKIVLERFADYWDKAAQGAAKVEILVLADNNARANALKSGQLDIINLDASQIDEFKKISGLKVTEGLSLSLMHVQLNRSKPFLDKKEVRQAMNMAVDRAALVKLANYGYGAPNNQYFPKGYFGYNEAISIDQYKYEPAKAKEMLKAAGVPDNWELDTVVPNLSYYLTLAQAVKDQMAAAGINLKLRPVDPVQTAPIFYVQQSGDVLISVFGGRADPAQLLNSLFTKGPIQNPGGHTTPKIVELVAKANEPGDQKARAAAVQAASKEIADEAMNVVMLHSSASFAWTEKLAGFQTWLAGKPEFRGVGLTK